MGDEVPFPNVWVFEDGLVDFDNIEFGDDFFWRDQWINTAREEVQINEWQPQSDINNNDAVYSSKS